jgi:uncharacterized membrane protein YjgN (DUF898 family)
MDQVQPITDGPITGGPATDGQVLTFRGTRRSFAKLLLVNSLLMTMTLGIYRFWAKTNIRRYFWRNVSFLDDPLEYTGTGAELFVGFLIVVAILFPLGVVYSVIDAVVPPDMQALHISLKAGYYMVLFALLQIGFYRMWRYRMSRTTWRGVRFGLDGSTWTYLRLAAGWTVLTVLTLGAAYPWMQIDLWRYQVRHTRLGGQAFRFEGNARALLSAWALPFAAILVNVAAAVWIATSVDHGTIDDFKSFEADMRQSLAIAIGLTISADIIGFVGYLYFRVRQARLQISGLRFADASFHSALPFWRLFFFGVLSVALIAAIFAAVGAVFAPTLMHDVATWQESAPDPFVMIGTSIFIVVAFVMLIFVMPFIWTLIFRYELIRQTVATTSITNPHVLERALQAASEGPRTGEGLADALDIGGF